MPCSFLLSLVANAYRKAAIDVMPKYNLFPTSVMAVDKFRVVQYAYECLINPETRAEYDTTLRELAAEEQSLFGERKARREVKEEEAKQLQKTPPPYVWNEDTNSPLFWTPGRKLIEGPKTDPESAPVAYFKRSSLDKQLVKVSTEVEPAKKPNAIKPSKPAHQRAPSSQAVALFTRAPLVQTQEVAKVRPAVSSQPSYFSEQHRLQAQQQHLHGWQYSLVAAEYMAKQHAQAQALEERHRRQVENERASLLHELEKRKRAVEKERRQKILVEQEVRRRLEEQEQEMATKFMERMKAKEEMERREQAKAEKKAKRSSAKQVRWDAGPLDEYKMPDTGPYGSGWWSEPELMPKAPRHNVLRKRRIYT